MADSFNALVLTAPGSPEVRRLSEAALGGKGALVDVLYSSINYKDALAVTGAGKIVRGTYPFVPGIDLVGRVVGGNGGFAAGDTVVLTGGGLGERFWGAYTERQVVPSTYLLKLPADIPPLWSMVVGTAGLTAMYSVLALETHGVTPESGDVVVTGASGGVGSFAVALLAKLGYTVVAASGKRAQWDYLRGLGAAQTIDRLRPGRALESARFSGAVDAAGGDSLAAVLSLLKRHGSVAASGNAAGHVLNTTVFPFILRGVNLLGIDSNTAPRARRVEAWGRLSALLDEPMIRAIHTGTVSLVEIPAVCASMIAAETHGRHVVNPAM